LGGGVVVITFDEVHKNFGSKRVLEGFSLEVPDGETTVVIGYSGTGKSVALKHIVGLLEPDSGKVAVDDRVVHELDRGELMTLRATVGFVFQFAALFDSMTVRENITLGLKRQRVRAREMDERVHESLAMVDMQGTEDRYPIQLSGGMRKRVGIARAIALRPHYILYDEPTSGLDPVTSAVINQLMVRAREKLGVTGLVVTHDMSSAYTVGARIAMLYNGVIRQVGTVEQIQKTHDPIVRQFIDGRPEAANDADRAATQVL
jgi:phospholipid/cholesterol/gamma-HCH transport system ATP-binding protein